MDFPHDGSYESWVSSLIFAVPVCEVVIAGREIEEELLGQQKTDVATSRFINLRMFSDYI